MGGVFSQTLVAWKRVSKIKGCFQIVGFRCFRFLAISFFWQSIILVKGCKSVFAFSFFPAAGQGKACWYKYSFTFWKVASFLFVAYWVFVAVLSRLVQLLLCQPWSHPYWLLPKVLQLILNKITLIFPAQMVISALWMLWIWQRYCETRKYLHVK